MSMILFAAAALALAPEPLAAAPIPPSEQARVAVKPTTIKPSTDMRRVCVVGDFPGTRINRRICQTRADWVALQGVDPLAAR